jgi:PAS domain S-box-containing protein
MQDALKSKKALLQALTYYRQPVARNLNEIRLNALLKLSQVNEKSLQEIMDFGLEEAIRLTDSKIGYIYYYNERTELFTLYSWSSSVMDQCAVIEKQTVYELQKTGLWGEAVRQRKPIVMNDYSAPNQYKKGYPEGHVPLTRHMNLPIFIGKKIVAVIGVGNKESDYTEDDVAQLQLFMDGLWNIAEKKRIEEELRKSEEKLRTVADFTYDWEYWIAPNMEILYCSPSCNRITGYSSEEFIKTPSLISSIMHTQDIEIYNNHIAHFHDPNKLFEEEQELEFRIITKNGEIKWIGHVCHQVFNEEGVFLGRRVSNRDITDRKHSEMMLIRSSEEIKRLNENILHMLKIVSHDIRGPLVAMAATLKLLQHGSYGRMDDSVANTVQDLSGRVKQILGIAEDYLGKAHAVDAHMKIEKYEIDLRQEVIDAVLDELSNEMEAGEITIDNKLGAIPSGAIVVNASKIWLKVVYRNLFKNAIKYGGYGCTIAFGYEDQGSFYRLNVYNTGSPIPEEKRSTLFTKFGRVEGGTVREGVGMGLYLTKEIIKRHGGDIWYEAKHNGSDFVFILPK